MTKRLEVVSNFDPAGTQPEARKIAEHQYPGYKAVTAQRA